MTDPREVRMTTTDREVETIAAGLTKAESDFVELLPDNGSPRHWPRGMEMYERAGLRGFGKSGLIHSRHDHSGSWIRLTPLGLAVRAHLASQERDKA